MDTALNTKIDLIKKTYYDPEIGLSIKKTFNKLKDQVSMKEIKDVIEKQGIHQIAKRTDMSDRFLHIVPSEPGEYQADLFFMGSEYKRANKGEIVMLIIICVPTRFMHIYPMKTKKTSDIIDALTIFIDSAIPKPTKIICDKGKEFASRTVNALCIKNDIDLIMVNKSENDNSHATAIVDRAVRTIREMISKYLEGYATNKYIDNLHKLVNNYNNSEHRTLGKAPSEMTTEDIEIFTGTLKGLNEDVYKKINDIQVGQRVRVIIKRKALAKGAFLEWSKKVHTIESKAGNHFKVSGITRPYFYHEIQLIDSSEDNPAIAGKSSKAKDELRDEKDRNRIDRKLKKEDL